jgi:hypothetical protein
VSKPLWVGVRLVVLLFTLTAVTRCFVERKIEPALYHRPTAHSAPAAATEKPPDLPATEKGPDLPKCYFANQVVSLEPIECLSQGGSTSKPRRPKGS